MEIVCLAVDRNKNCCRTTPIKDSRFCKFHQYMDSYTSEMLAKLEICSGCKKAYHFDKDVKICDKCKMRSKINRENKKDDIILCSKEGCKYKKSIENKYCKVHQIEIFIDEVKEENKKMCKNYIRGCRVKLEEDYTLSKCQDCLAYDREKDKEKRNKIKEEKNSVTITENPTEMRCNSCCKKLPISEFIGIRKEYTKTCKSCRENNRIQDEKRNKEHRNELARVNDAKPERIEVKNQWKEDNYEKVAGYWMNSRENKIERLGVDEYLKENAEQAKKWRENNPEKVKVNNENKINSYELQYGVYKRSAELKQLEFVITFEEYTALVKNQCHYCGIIQDRGFNGIDRENSTNGYILENCVSCCKMCNYMKRSLSGDVFVKRIEHILTFNGEAEGKKYPELFGDHLTNWSKYKDSALRKQLDFTITPNNFDEITKNPCYICGKEDTKTHKNGIDRYDNDVGYLSENCRPCCGECNYMKRDYSYDDMFSKFKIIYEKNKKNGEMKAENIVISIEENDDSVDRETNIISFVKGNKKTLEQIKEQTRLRKQKQRENLKERYSDEDYKKMRAKEISEYRKKLDKNIFVKRTPEQIRETNRIRKQRQRESELNLLKESSLQYPILQNTLQIKIENDKVTEYNINEQIENLEKQKKTPDEIREQNRIRKQRQREREKNDIENKL